MCNHKNKTWSSAVVTGTNNSQCKDCGIIIPGEKIEKVITVFDFQKLINENNELKKLLDQSREYMFYGLDAPQIDELIEKIDIILGNNNR
jgi:hypothetical protein